MDITIPKHVKEAIKDTVGYSEAKNQQNYLMGASVAFMKAEDHYAEIIKRLEHSLKYTNEELEEVKQDMRTLVNIITKYQDRES
jgi:hypothetical protein